MNRPWLYRWTLDATTPRRKMATTIKLIAIRTGQRADCDGCVRHRLVPQIGNFCEQRGLSLSAEWPIGQLRRRVLPSVHVRGRRDAEVFRAQFGGERMHPSEKGKGTTKSLWKKASGESLGCVHQTGHSPLGRLIRRSRCDNGLCLYSRRQLCP
jgi:hypothetical protein